MFELIRSLRLMEPTELLSFVVVGLVPFFAISINSGEILLIYFGCWPAMPWLFRPCLAGSPKLLCSFVCLAFIMF